MKPVISEVRVVDDPVAWRSVGFTVAADGSVTVGTVCIRVVADDEVLSTRPGIAGWTLAGVTHPNGGGGETSVDGLPTRVVSLAADEDDHAGPGAEIGLRRNLVHANGVTRVDHVVVLTPDLDRTTTALHTLGLEPRRTRAAGLGPDGVPRRQRFFRLGEVILELVGPDTPTGEGPARFWGLAYVVDDLDATAQGLGERMSQPRDAVQPGRRIAALRPAAGLAVPTAFLTPEGRPGPG